MFCNAICRYKAQTPDLVPPGLGEVFPAAEDDPKQSERFLLSSRGTFPKFTFMDNGKTFTGFLGIRDGSHAFVFKLVRAKEGNRSGIVLNNDLYVIRRHYSLLPMSQISLDEQGLVCLFFLRDQTVDEVKKMLDLENEAKVVCSGEEGMYRVRGKSEKDVLPTKCKITARDGVLWLEPEILISDKPLSVTGNSFLSFDDLESSVDYELSKNEDNVSVIRALISRLKFCGHSYIEHALVKNDKSFFFTFIVTQNEASAELTVFMSEKLFSFLEIYNWAFDEPSKMRALVEIPSFVDEKAVILLKGQNALPEYRLNPFRIHPLLQSALKGVSLLSRDPRTMFWVMAYAIDAIKPFPWPGIVLVPIIEKMKYLLHGPYSFFVATEDQKLCESFPAIVKEFATLLDLCNEADHGRESLQGTISQMLKGQPKREKLIEKIVLRRLEIPPVFPLSVPSDIPLFERLLMENATFHTVRFIYDLDTLSFLFPCTYIYNEDPLILWLIIFPGSLDYNSLLAERWDWEVYGYMVRRACIDRDGESLKKIIDFVDKHKIACKKEIAKHMTNFPKKKENPPLLKPYFSECRVINLCTCHKGDHVHFASESSKEESCVEFEISYEDRMCDDADCKKKTLIYANNSTYRLIPIQSLLGCYESGFFSDEVCLNILVYMRTYNLPLEEPFPASDDSIKFSID